MQVNAFYPVTRPPINIDMSSLKSPINLLFYVGIFLGQGCDDGAGKPDPASITEAPSCAVVLYKDADGDGYGDPNRAFETCDRADGWVDNALDCDDDNAGVSPSAPEICDGVDTNCDGVIDDDSAVDATDWFDDNDGDGFGFGPPRGFGCAGDGLQVTNNDDCDDGNEDVNPTVSELCDDIDNDCDGDIDEGETIDGVAFYADTDLDGWGNDEDAMYLCAPIPGRVAQAGDCDDEDEHTFPDADERCDGHDRDCDGYIDSQCNIILADADADAIFRASDGFMLSHMSVGDVTGDGADDLILGNSFGQKLHLLASPIDAAAPSPDWVLSIGDAITGTTQSFDATKDVDGDGVNDLILAHHALNDTYEYDNGIEVHLGPFSAPPTVNSPDFELTSTSMERWGYDGLLLADLDGDDISDAIFTNESGDVIRIWSDLTEDGSMETDSLPLTIPGRSSEGDLAAGDLNADGMNDLIYSSGHSNVFEWLPGPIVDSGDVMSPEAASYGTSGHVLGAKIRLCDFTGDGHSDIVTSTSSSDGVGSEPLSQLLIFDGASLSSDLDPVLVFDAEGEEILMAECFDADGDSRVDLLVQSPLHSPSDTAERAGLASLYFGPLEGSMERDSADRSFRGTTTEGYFGWLATGGDFDGDGFGEVVIAYPLEGVHIFATEAWLSPSWAAHSD
jgi:hypothetical protein